MTIPEKSPPSYKEILDHLYEGVYFVDRERYITYWNQAAERITGFAADKVLDSRCSDNILTHMGAQGKHLCLEQCPVALTMMDCLPRKAEAFLHHREGHRVPVLVRISPLRDATGAVIGAVELFSDNSARKAINEHLKELENLALIDPLTKLANRRYIQMALENRLQELKRHGWTSGVIFLDIDGFKQINDTNGHQVGDRILVMIANTLLLNSRPFDVFGRWGGRSPILKVFATPERMVFGLKQMVAYLHQNGVTAYMEPGALLTPDIWKLYQQILGAENTPFYSYFVVDARTQVDSGLGPAESLADTEKQIALPPQGKVSFFPRQIKLFADGAIISQLMQMKDGYTDGHHGEWMMTPKNLDQRAQLYWNAGYQLHTHVNGDLGLETVLNVLERRMRENPRAEHRSVIVHFACSTEEQVARIARLGAIVSANPYYTVGFADKYAKVGLGPQRADAMWPWLHQ